VINLKDMVVKEKQNLLRTYHLISITLQSLENKDM